MREVLGDDAGPVLRHGATLMMKPDGLAAGKLGTVSGFLRRPTASPWLRWRGRS